MVFEILITLLSGILTSGIYSIMSSRINSKKKVQIKLGNMSLEDYSDEQIFTLLQKINEINDNKYFPGNENGDNEEPPRPVKPSKKTKIPQKNQKPIADRTLLLHILLELENIKLEIGRGGKQGIWASFLFGFAFFILGALASILIQKI